MRLGAFTLSYIPLYFLWEDFTFCRVSHPEPEHDMSQSAKLVLFNSSLPIWFADVAANPREVRGLSARYAGSGPKGSIKISIAPGQPGAGAVYCVEREQLTHTNPHADRGPAAPIATKGEYSPPEHERPPPVQRGPATLAEVLGVGAIN